MKKKKLQKKNVRDITRKYSVIQVKTTDSKGQEIERKKSQMEVGDILLVNCLVDE